MSHMAFAPVPTLFRHFIEEAQGQTGSVYGRKMYEVMRYWVVLGHGKPYFTGPRPRLRLMTHDRIDEDMLRLTYVPA